MKTEKKVHTMNTAILLASASPRRQELLARMGLSFTVCPAELDESRWDGLPPQTLVESLSQAKGEVVAASAPAGTLVIAADTVVVLDGQVLGKPRDEAEAASMLALLSGRTHEVYTGLSIRRDALVCTTHQITSVCFRSLTEEDITRYVKTGEPMDKAGAYGIQGYGAMLVSTISGDYFNVMGLPVCLLAQLLTAQFGLNPLALAAGSRASSP
jgi:septum formation protein